MSILDSHFFNKPALKLAEMLLGKIVISKFGNEFKYILINETEAYLGEEDKGSHARFGKTERNKYMYKSGGIWYVYLIYGIHLMMNVVAGSDKKPEAVLIRGGFGIDENKNILNKNINGPGKFSKYLNSKRIINGKSIEKKNGIWIEDWGIPPFEIQKTPRIGIDYSEDWKEKEMRFVGLFDKL